MTIDNITHFSGTTGSHTNAGNLMVIISYFNSLAVQAGATHILEPVGGGSIKYNGVNVDYSNYGNFQARDGIYASYLKNPAAGVHNVVISPAFTCGLETMVVTFNNADLISQFDEDLSVFTDFVNAIATSISETKNASQAGNYILGGFAAIPVGSNNTHLITSGTVVHDVTFISSEDSTQVSVWLGYITSPTSGAGANTFQGTWTRTGAMSGEGVGAVTVNNFVNRGNPLFYAGD